MAYVQGVDRTRSAADILAHLERCRSCHAMVADAARGHVDAEGARAGAAPLVGTVQPDERLCDRYRIIRNIGRGGMGEVYEAVDEQLNESVALKTLTLAILDNDAAVARFKSEVQLARRVTHPNVCRVFDFFVHSRRRDNGDSEQIPFLTMELLRGQTLRTSLTRQRPMDPQAARPLLKQMLAGLAAVHQVGIVHRDLKTDNDFLVEEAGPVPRAVLMDFGLARPVASVGGGGASSASGLVGTAAYMAPEQVEGRPASPRSDIYSLGVMLFEMLTGALPFQGISTAAMAAARLQARPPLASSVVADLDAGWTEVIARCLQRRPEDRYASVQELQAALFARFPRRRPRASLRWGVFTAGTALAVGALATALVQVSRSPRSAPLPPTRVPEPAVSAPPERPPTLAAAPAPAPAPQRLPARSPAAPRRPAAGVPRPPIQQPAESPVQPEEIVAPPAAPSSGRLTHPDGLLNPFAR